ncbi:hypothetical protein KY290_007710 [Solanum tuberosum]|uniref:Uncharacterized protein n=1 Tax=Solanum tuberosum TaxID=4113 RepID=A0ABQ7W6D0_SOLTU|nr:hypothetical protein KY290_007710 [Solanum tuberosum]
MANSSGGLIHPEDFPPLTQPGLSKSNQPNQVLQNYVELIKPKPLISQGPKVPPKPVVLIYGEPNITWKSSEIRSLIIEENLHYAIIRKFSYGKPEKGELRKSIPKQCGIKGENTIGGILCQSKGDVQANENFEVGSMV